MFLVERDKSLHIENYNDESNEKEYDFDRVFWDDCLVKIIKFTDDNIVGHLHN